MGSFRYFSWLLILSVILKGVSLEVQGLACNWGSRASHPLPAKIVVQLLRDNGFDKVKLFEADPEPLKALGHSGIEVMVGIPNDLLLPLASNVQAAINWVSQNVSTFISKYGVDIRYESLCIKLKHTRQCA